jgi:hypothetical protein
VLDGILNTSQGYIVYNVSRKADHKKVAKSLVKDQFRRNAGVRATNDNCKGLLTFGNFLASPCILSRMFRFTHDTPFVSIE